MALDVPGKTMWYVLWASGKDSILSYEYMVELITYLTS